MCVFAEQSSAYDIVGGDGWHVRWGKGWAQSLEQLPIPSFHTHNTNAVHKDIPGDFREREFTPQAGLESLWVHLLALCTCLMMSVILWHRVEKAPPLNIERNGPLGLCLQLQGLPWSL